MRQDVQQEAADEFLDRQRHLPAPAVVAVVLVGESDLAVGDIASCM